MPDSPDLATGSPASKPTGPLTAASAAPPDARLQDPLTIPESLPDRNFFLRLGELAIFLVAIVGAVALGLAITSYFTDHTFIAAYLLAYAGFRFADLLVSDDYSPDPSRDAVVRRVAEQGPLLLLFFAAPFERTYIWGGEPHRWLISGVALALELMGLWLALGARIQLAFFSPKIDGGNHAMLVQNGFYRFVRHPRFAGIYLALVGWPIAYGAPISALLTITVVGIVMRRLIHQEEALMLDRYGDDYRKYQDATDAMIPNIW